MLLRRTILSCTTIRYHSSDTRNLQSLAKIHIRDRAKAIQQAQEVLTDYLHTVRSIPYTFAENIIKYSVVSQSAVISKFLSEVKFSVPNFSNSLQRFLRYHPVNEFKLFFESIGIDVNELDGVLPAHKLFLSEDVNPFNAACALYGFGVRWNMLGMLYKQDKTIFDKNPCELKEIWSKYMEDYGFTSSSLIGVCLVFPHVLSNGGSALFNDLKRVIIDSDLINDVDGNVDSWIDICRKIRLFYSLGCKNYDVFEMIGRSKTVLVEFSEEFLSEKIEYFCRFDVAKEEVMSLLLSRCEFFEFDLKTPVFCVMGLLRHFGMDEQHLISISKKYPYVFGKNRFANLPHVMRALNLNQWFFDNLKHGGHHLLKSYPVINSDQDSDKDFAESLARAVESSRLNSCTLSKLQFLHGIGYGENGLTIKMLNHVHGNNSQLKQRFDCLIHNGIEFSKLCNLISRHPILLSLNSESLEKKMKFLCEDIGYSLDYLDVFPAYFCFDLEKRIKPRYKFHTWLMETGLCKREYSLASVIVTTERKFVARIYGIHPAALKRYLEIFMKQDYDTFQET